MGRKSRRCDRTPSTSTGMDGVLMLRAPPSSRQGWDEIRFKITDVIDYRALPVHCRCSVWL